MKKATSASHNTPRQEFDLYTFQGHLQLRLTHYASIFSKVIRDLYST
jgi:hypothetical protein